MFPMKNGGSFHSYVKLPEGTPKGISDLALLAYPLVNISGKRKITRLWVNQGTFYGHVSKL